MHDDNYTPMQFGGGKSELLLSSEFYYKEVSGVLHPDQSMNVLELSLILEFINEKHYNIANN